MPEKGEIWLMDMGLAEKVRPALVLSGPCGPEDRLLVTVIPHTTQLRGSRFEVDIPLAFLKPGAFLVQSPVTLSHKRALKYLGKLTASQTFLVESRLLEWLQINPAAHAKENQMP